jgi:hypothetical protein
MPADQPMGADVEIVEPYTTRTAGGDLDKLPYIKPYQVRVNGTDVGLIQRDSLTVDLGSFPERAATVTLTLLVKSVTIKAE